MNKIGILIETTKDSMQEMLCTPEFLEELKLASDHEELIAE